jgi:hypothetical protein
MSKWGGGGTGRRRGWGFQNFRCIRHLLCEEGWGVRSGTIKTTGELVIKFSEMAGGRTSFHPINTNRMPQIDAASRCEVPGGLGKRNSGESDQ